MPHDLLIGELATGGKVFELDGSVVTSTQAIIARKRSGKSYTADVMAEEMLKSKQQVGIVDPTGAHFGLRASADGSGEGFPVMVFGGDHGDIPLNWRAGREMALAFIEHGFSAIWDISNFETEEQISFVNDFAREMLKSNREAVHIFIDEADTYAPQMLESKLQKICLGSVRRLVKQGGVRGVGLTLITQRSSDLSKSVLSQVDSMVALTVSHPPDIAPIVEWVSANVGTEAAGTLKAEMPRLPVGEAFFCSRDRMCRVKIRRRETFNSGATPKPGERRVEPQVLAKIDIEKLGKQITESVEVARASDPTELKKKIAALEAQMVKGDVTMELQQRIADLEAQAARVPELERQVAAAFAGSEDFKNITVGFLADLKRMVDTAYKVLLDDWADPGQPSIQESVGPCLVAPARRPELAGLPPASTDNVEGLSTSQSKILISLAELAACGILEPQRIQVAMFAGYSNAKSGGFSVPVANMVANGKIRNANGTLSITADGLRAIGGHRPAATTEQLHQKLEALLSAPSWKILRQLIHVYPNPIERTVLAERTGYGNAKSGGFSVPLSRLISLGLANIPTPGTVVGAPLLFLDEKQRVNHG